MLVIGGGEDMGVMGDNGGDMGGMARTGRP